MQLSKNNRGDTIVEVLLSLAILSAVLFSCWTIINKATQMGLVARQRVNMVNRLKEQAEILQSQRDNNTTSMATFKSLVTSGQTSSQLSEISANACDDALTTQPASAATAKYYYFGLIGTDNVLEKKTGFKLVDNNETARVWVQYIDYPTAGYIDFYIRGCWQVPGGAQNYDSSQFIVRLNV